jgi:hypothetical protein
MPYEDFDKQRLTSSSHLTVSQNIEIRNLLNQCNSMATTGNLAGWRWKLNCLERELYFDLKRLDEDCPKDKKTFEQRLTLNYSEIDKLINKQVKSPTEYKDKQEEYYQLLHQREIILRDLQ